MKKNKCLGDDDSIGWVGRCMMHRRIVVASGRDGPVGPFRVRYSKYVRRISDGKGTSDIGVLIRGKFCDGRLGYTHIWF